ncbi:MAG: hypothetical protein ACR2K6_07880 [Solirubrobacterales bacterium]
MDPGLVAGQRRRQDLEILHISGEYRLGPLNGDRNQMGVDDV